MVCVRSILFFASSRCHNACVISSVKVFVKFADIMKSDNPSTMHDSLAVAVYVSNSVSSEIPISSLVYGLFGMSRMLLSIAATIHPLNFATSIDPLYN